MTDYRNLEQCFTTALNLTRRPIAVTFQETPPAGIPAFVGTVPSGCSFWRIAAEGETFYTVPSDHFNCAIGSYTHAMPLPAERAVELTQTLEFMTGIGYVRMEDVPSIPVLPKTPQVVIYSPLGEATLSPDLVIFLGTPGRLMLLQEAATRSGVGVQTPLMARPTCMALPAALTSGVVASTACVGNRVYTDIGEDALYVVVPGNFLHQLMGELQTITDANSKLSEYHKGRRLALSTV